MESELAGLVSTMCCLDTAVSTTVSCSRVKLAVHKDTRECVAVKMVHVDDSNGLTHESLRKEVILKLTIV